MAHGVSVMCVTGLGLDTTSLAPGAGDDDTEDCDPGDPGDLGDFGGDFGGF